MPSSADLYPPIRSTNARDLAHIPGDMGLPVLGISVQLALDFEGTIRKFYAQYGNICRSNIFLNTGLLINGPENVRRIQLNTEREFSNWVGYANTVAEWFGKAILFRDFEDHRLQRRVVMSAFSADAMRGYVTQSNEIVEHAIVNWGDEKNFIALPHLRQLLIHVAAKIFYGIDDLSVGANKLGDAFSAMLSGMETLIKIDSWPFKYRRGVKGKKLVREYLKSLLPPQAETLSGKELGNNLMAYMVRASLDEQPPTLTEEELIDHLSLLFFAGYDTTTTTLTHMLMHLGMDQKLQETLREESRALDKAQPDYDDLEKLKGIHYTFQETLRLYPATPFTMRGTAVDCEMGGYRIPANTMLFIPSIVNHTLPEFWENALTFDPSRFAPGREEHKKLHGAHYYPFGGGAHKCVGMYFAAMNAKVFMHQLLLKYRFKTPDNYAPKMIKLPMPRPADNLPLTFERL